MPAARFLGIALVAALLLTGASEATRWLSRNVPARLKIAEIAAPADAECVALGNSLMQSGFAKSAFDATADKGGDPCPSLNASLGATDAVEHDLLLREVLRAHSESRVFYYGFFDLQLTRAPAVAMNDLLGNRIVGLLLDRRRAMTMYDMDWRTRVVYTLFGSTDLFLDRGQVWSKVELLRRQMTGLGRTVAPASADVFAELEPASEMSFAAALRGAVVRGAQLSSPIRDILQSVQARHGRPVFVVMPMPSTHRRFYRLPEWKTYLDYVTALVGTAGGEVCDASSWIAEPDMFADAVHLTPAGAAFFSSRLADETLRDRHRLMNDGSCGLRP